PVLVPEPIGLNCESFHDTGSQLTGTHLAHSIFAAFALQRTDAPPDRVDQPDFRDTDGSVLGFLLIHLREPVAGRANLDDQVRLGIDALRAGDGHPVRAYEENVRQPTVEFGDA